MLVLGGVVGYRYARTNELPFLPDSTFLKPWEKVTGGMTSNESTTDSKIEVKNAEPEVAKAVDFRTFWEVWRLLESDYVDSTKLDATKMLDGAIGGLTSSLGDPYTVYLPPNDNQRSGEDLAGAFFGVGIELGYVDNTLAVVSPLKGTPAERAGLKPGDMILHVKDDSKNFSQDTSGWSLNEAVSHIRGAKGTSVILTIYRKDDAEKKEPFEVTLQREEIVVNSVELSYSEHNGKRVAHIKLSRFGERTKSEWDTAVKDILAQKNLAGIVLDMRNNPGGFFDGAIDIASDFVESGVVVSQKGKFTSQDYKAKGSARLAKYQVEVLVNRGSASAAEIVAGALRDRKDAKLIGEKTFGKGTVQDRRELANGGGIHITVARWLMPKGEWIHETGIPVNIEVKDDPKTEADEVLVKAIDEI